ncbi:MAG TPA: hypothetical protein VM802_02915 [Chitinophaga sp.]|uniref:hypothetical protein n=1 Tax=Chitinophaga sp. TaxID=1869181 RepID=UPI002C03C350|nr:hypothetical protein [Chitinophaga sp.]HVI43788.1 hypothetical protein [Chitinophaga sp.]
MKTRSDQLELSQYGLTEMNTEEMWGTNGGGIVGNILGGVINLVTSLGGVVGPVLAAGVGLIVTTIPNLLALLLDIGRK